MEKYANLDRQAVIKKCRKNDRKGGKTWCLYTSDGTRLLGRHKTKEDAQRQESAIHANSSEKYANLDRQALLDASFFKWLWGKLKRGGGKAVIDEAEEQGQLTPEQAADLKDMEPSSKPDPNDEKGVKAWLKRVGSMVMDKLNARYGPKEGKKIMAIFLAAYAAPFPGANPTLPGMYILWLELKRLFGKRASVALPLAIHAGVSY